MFEYNTDKEVIKIHDLERRIRNGEDLEFDDFLIELPTGKILTFEEYLDGGYNVQHSTPQSNHPISPMLKPQEKVPDGIGSKSKKRSKRYWEEMYERFEQQIKKKIVK
jgi:hypothetical protein